MVFKFIIPIDKSEDSDLFINKMHCMKCKIRGGLTAKHNLPIIEEGYHFDIISCECSNCSETVDLKFFNENSFTNQTLKKILVNPKLSYIVEDSKENSKNKKAFYSDSKGL